MVFQEYFSPSHDRIRRLLLVCKRWYAIIIGNPKLWARIDICGGSDLLNSEIKLSHIPYITACIERSKGAPLNVTLNLQHLPTSFEYVRQRIETAIMELVHDWECSDVQQWTQDLDFPFHCPHYPLAVRRAIRCIVGEHARHMQRWSSLELQLPDDPLSAELLWKGLHGRTPNLKCLTIPRSSYQFHDNSLHPRGLPDLSSITYLKVLDNASLSSFSLSPAKLQHLEIVCDIRLFNIGYISSFIMLHTLKLHGHTPSGFSTLSSTHDTSLITISLPRLRKLSLSGNYSYLCPVTFDVPQLELLQVRSERLFQKLPKLSAPHIRWDVWHWIIKYWNLDDVALALSSLLLLSERVVTLRFPAFATDEALRQVTKYRRQGRLFALIEFIIDHEDGCVEYVKV